MFKQHKHIQRQQIQFLLAGSHWEQHLTASSSADVFSSFQLPQPHGRLFALLEKQAEVERPTVAF